MSSPIYAAAIRAGCTHRQAQLLAVYVVSEKLADAALELDMAESTAKNHMTAIRRKLHAPHAAAVIARLLS